MKRAFTIGLAAIALAGCGLSQESLTTVDATDAQTASLSVLATDSAEVPTQPPAPAELFAAIDADADGYLSPEEFAAHKPPQGARPGRGHGPRPMPEPAEIIAHLDTDGDGKVSLAEFEAGRPKHDPESRFSALDADADGYVTSEELAAKAPPAPEDARGPKPDPAMLITHLDADGDGKLSLEEFKKGPGRPPMFGHRR